MAPMRSQLAACAVMILAVVTTLGWPAPAAAMPAFARQYDMSCAACHSAFPRLNAFGEQFRDANYRLPNWKQKTTIDMGDDMLALPKFPPLAIRAQAFVQYRQAREVEPDYSTFTTNNAEIDFQAPYLIKLLSSAPLSDHITYYFYGIFAEKGENGTSVIEDAWFRHDDAFGSGIGAMLGQFQVSDVMFPRETRMTFQDYMAYRFAGITYERGLLLDRKLGPVDLALGVVNGSGIDASYSVNSPGYRRPDRMFDNDNQKSVFARLGAHAGPVKLGVFGLSGSQKSANDLASDYGATTGTRDTDKRVYGLDLSGQFGPQTYWFAQGLWNQWDGFLDSDPTRNYRWFGGFVGVDYIYSPRWAYSLLYNYADAGDLDNPDTIYRGINVNTLTLTASYYFMRNVKGVIELSGDFQAANDTPPLIGHASKEGYILVGLDAAF